MVLTTSPILTTLDGGMTLERIQPDLSRVLHGETTLGYAVSVVRNGHVMWAPLHDREQDTTVPDFTYASRIDAANSFLL